jgi:hypothetical protein
MATWNMLESFLLRSPGIASLDELLTGRPQTNLLIHLFDKSKYNPQIVCNKLDLKLKVVRSAVGGRTDPKMS